MLKDPLAAQILAVLFVAKEPVSLPQLHQVFPDTSSQDLARLVKELAEEFNTVQDSVEVRQVAGGYRMNSHARHHEIIRRYLKSRPSARLSLAALETLAVIAYKQPVTLPEIAEIRGVKGTSTIRTLLEKKLIEAQGRKKTVGRPILYGIGRQFLVHFGLNDLSELPTLAEFEEILSS